ncbi:hypothetical protein Tco_0190918 [Tanacetum coccineum]
MFLNLDQLEKQLDKEEFQENGSMAAFRVIKTQFYKFIDSRFSLDDDDGLMTCKYFHTRIEVQQFHDTLIQHMEYVKKSIDERALHKRQYDSRVNERQITTLHQESQRIVHSERGDDVAIIKRRRQDLHRDGVKDLPMASGRGRLKEDLESCIW